MLGQSRLDMLEKRIEELERAIGLGITETCLPDGEVIFASTFHRSNGLKINEVVAAVAKKAGVHYHYGKPAEIK